MRRRLRWSLLSPHKGTEHRVSVCAHQTRVDDVSKFFTCPDFPDCAGVPPHKIRAELSSNSSQLALRTDGLTPHFHAELLRMGIIPSGPTSTSLYSRWGRRLTFPSRFHPSRFPALLWFPFSPFHGVSSAVHFGYVATFVLLHMTLRRRMATLVCSIDLTTASNSTKKQLSTLSTLSRGS